MKKNAKILKNFYNLNGATRWNQQELSSYCPIAPLKKTILTGWFHLQYTKKQSIKTSVI